MRAILIAALVALAGCGSEPVTAPRAPDPGMTTYSDDRRGFSVRFPSHWHRAAESLTPNLVDPREILSVGTAEPAVDAGRACAQHPVAALDRLGPEDVFVTVQESSGTSSEMLAGRPRLAATATERGDAPQCLGRQVPFRTYWMPFRDGDRGFYAHAAVGHRAPEDARRQLQAVLDSLIFEPRRREDDRQRGVAFSHPDDWHVYPFQLTEAVGLPQQIALGTFAVDQQEPDPNCAPRTAVDARPADGGMLFVFEYADLNHEQLGRIPPRRRAFALDEPEPQGYECFGTSHLIRWREHGRAFQAHLYGPPRRVQQALGILDTFEISPRQR